MERITIEQALPRVFQDGRPIESEVWNAQVEFQKGKTYLVEAASGTGKSSLLSYIYGYRRDYQGIICFDGENIRNYSVSQWVAVRKRSISMLFQELRLFGELTAWENVQLKNTLTGYADKKLIRRWFEALGISDKWNERIDKMSFGQQQRVAFIRALCQPFDFIFLDEPISHLDDGNSRIMSEILIEETKKQGAGIVVTSIGKHLPLNYDRIISL